MGSQELMELLEGTAIHWTKQLKAQRMLMIRCTTTKL